MGYTQFRLTTSGLASESSRTSHKGWPQILTWLQGYVERQGKRRAATSYHSSSHRIEGAHNRIQPDTKIIDSLAVPRLCVPIGHYWYLFKRLTAGFVAWYFRFVKIVVYSFCIWWVSRKEAAR